MSDYSPSATELSQGPRKEVPPDTPTQTLTTHKVRSTWFQAREAWPVREAPVQTLIRERTRVAVEMPPAPGLAEWSPVGPANIGGRMTCAVCAPAAPEQLWAGAAGGGIWHSADAGQSWQPLWHNEASLNIGALAIDPQEPDIIYSGTGEANLSADSHPGVGLFRSMDAGGNWQPLAESETAGLPRRIGALAVDPSNSNHLLVGGVGHSQNEASGLYISFDGGVTWARVPLVGGSFYRCHDVRFHPNEPGLIYVTISALGMQNGIWRSNDNGASWSQLAGGLPSPDLIGRTSLALAPSDPRIMYAQASRKGEVLGVFRSSNGGDSWTSISGTHFIDERQMSYNNTIAVHPEDPDWVLCGGVDLHRTTDAGQTWTRVTQWNAERGTSTYAHADHHALVMPTARPGWVYDLNDGGLDFSDDGGTTWANRCNGLATNMFYDLAVAQSDGQMIAGGAQDNGTLATLDGGPDTYFEMTGGDGGWVIIDPEDNRHLFTTVQGMKIFRFRSSDGWTQVSPPEDLFEMWMVFLSMDARNRTTLFTGSRRVWRTTDDGDTWQPMSDNLDDSDITALEITRADSTRVYVGTENGGIFRSTDSGVSWSDNLASTVLPGRTVTRLESRPDNADVLYATVANFGNPHVFRSVDGGLSWSDIDHGQLPDAPFHSVAVPTTHPERVYVCGDAGVFVSPEEGATWSNLTRNLPNVMVVDLVYHEADHSLTAATYGRSFWRLQLD
jgi:photosystem II stability/assembly factor-like uncharacterized protein